PERDDAPTVSTTVLERRPVINPEQDPLSQVRGPEPAGDLQPGVHRRWGKWRMARPTWRRARWAQVARGQRHQVVALQGLGHRRADLLHLRRQPAGASVVRTKRAMQAEPG